MSDARRNPLLQRQRPDPPGTVTDSDDSNHANDAWEGTSDQDDEELPKQQATTSDTKPKSQSTIKPPPPNAVGTNAQLMIPSASQSSCASGVSAASTASSCSSSFDSNREMAKMVIEQVRAIQQAKLRVRKAQREGLREKSTSLADELSEEEDEEDEEAHKNSDTLSGVSSPQSDAVSQSLHHQQSQQVPDNDEKGASKISQKPAPTILFGPQDPNEIGRVPSRTPSTTSSTASNSGLLMPPHRQQRQDQSTIQRLERQHEQDQQRIRQMNETVQETQQALSNVQEHAALKIQKMELEVAYLKKALSDANAKLSKLVVVNQSLTKLAATALHNPQTPQTLKQQELETEREFEKVLLARKQAVEENYRLKRFFLTQLCTDCRSKLPSRKSPLKTPISQCMTSEEEQQDGVKEAAKMTETSTNGPAPESAVSIPSTIGGGLSTSNSESSGTPKRPTYQHAAQKLMEEIKSPKVPIRGILKSNSGAHYSTRSNISATGTTNGYDGGTVATTPNSSGSALTTTTATDNPAVAAAMVSAASETPGKGAGKQSRSTSRAFQPFKSLLRRSPSSGSLNSFASGDKQPSSVKQGSPATQATVASPASKEGDDRSVGSATSSLHSESRKPDWGQQQHPRKVYPKEAVHGAVVTPGTRSRHFSGQNILVGMEVGVGSGFAGLEKSGGSKPSVVDEAATASVQISVDDHDESGKKKKGWKKRVFGWKGKSGNGSRLSKTASDELMTNGLDDEDDNSNAFEGE